ncbi:hypothetical protein [Cellulomonas sp. P5_C6]
MALSRPLARPVVVADDERCAPPLAEAHVTGGLPVAELTRRAPATLALPRTMSRHGGLLIGAGTVLDAAEVDEPADSRCRVGRTWPGFRTPAR